MDLDLSPKLAKKVYGDDAGSYYAWCPDELPMLRQGNIGAAKLALEKNGFALPLYSDSSKVAYVLQGAGVAGIILPESEEKVIAIKKGDAIALPFGVITWWYNKEDTELVVLFMGDTSKGHKPGQFTDFFLTGANGIFTGFTTDFVKRAWDVDDDTATALIGNQKGKGIVKLDANFKMPEPKPDHRKGMALNCEEAPLDTDIKNAGNVVLLNTKNLPLVGQVGMGADLVRLEGNAMCSPGFSCDSALQVTYIVKGSGRLQVVGVDGKRVLETIVKAGNLLIVPRFFVVSKIADPDGLSWFSIITTPNPMFTHLAGSIGAWKAISPEVLQAAFKVPAETEKLFRSKRTNDAIFFRGNLLFFLSLVFLFLESSIAVDTITPADSINDSQTIVSAGHKFELGFFNTGDSNYRYLGIWYKNIPVRTVVWVANREFPLENNSGLLKLGDDGTLSIVNESRSIIWSSNSSLTAKNPVAELLDTGNLVVKDAGDDNDERYLWQSFDYPSDTLLPGMKLGWNKKTGLNRHLTSWKSSDDPSPGEYTYSVDPRGLPQLVLRKGSDEQFRSGPWYGTQFSGVPVLKVNPVFTPIFVSNADEVYYSYNITANIPSRFVLSQSGSVQHLSWNDRHSNWYLIFTVQEDRCDNYDLCGSYGICNINRTPNCDCLKGFEPKSSKDWDVLDWSGGCVRKDPHICHEGEGFVKFTGLKLPDASQFRVNVSMTIGDCEAECLKNCSCAAYAKLDIRGTGNGCVTWYEDLIDIRQAPQYGQDLYIRMAASALEKKADTSNNRKNVTIATTISVASAMIILVLIGWFLSWKQKMIRTQQPENQLTISKVETEEDLELPLFEFATIQAATNNFSPANKIGEGGYGPVFKGEIPTGQEVAVKRLAENSGQGLQEFKNEVLLISNLQHRNLVKLLGCCIEREERMLVYEYMPNRSLDSLIFDESRRSSLDWRRRYDIIVGIARGLLYLHRDSRLRIIHRDLKASNVLLDNEMNPKISDFGMARTFCGDQTEANTKRIVGTYGYMPPEYAIDGHFSLKSDVFSFGVILLEMVSGKKNRGFFHSTHKLNLLGHAWKLWNEGRALELMDELMEQDFAEEEALRYIQVGLLCVQQRPEDRPVMQTVVLMLDSESMSLPQPGRPGFYAERCLSETDSSSLGNLISNEMTVTLLEGR